MCRKCSKCQGEMIENLSLVPDDVWGGLRIYKEGVENLKCFVKPSVAVCKDCGNIKIDSAAIGNCPICGDVERNL